MSSSSSVRRHSVPPNSDDTTEFNIFNVFTNIQSSSGIDDLCNSPSHLTLRLYDPTTQRPNELPATCFSPHALWTVRLRRANPTILTRPCVSSLRNNVPYHSLALTPPTFLGCMRMSLSSWQKRRRFPTNHTKLSLSPGYGNRLPRSDGPNSHRKVGASAAGVNRR
jgi:hypothetical protein